MTQVFIKTPVVRVAAPPEVQRAETRAHATYAHEQKQATINIRNT